MMLNYHMCQHSVHPSPFCCPPAPLAPTPSCKKAFYCKKAIYNTWKLTWYLTKDFILLLNSLNIVLDRYQFSKFLITSIISVYCNFLKTELNSNVEDVLLYSTSWIWNLRFLTAVNHVSQLSHKETRLN